MLRKNKIKFAIMLLIVSLAAIGFYIYEKRETEKANVAVDAWMICTQLPGSYNDLYIAIVNDTTLLDANAQIGEYIRLKREEKNGLEYNQTTYYLRLKRNALQKKGLLEKYNKYYKL